MQKLKNAPTLNTILMVEEALKNMPDSVMKIAELKRALPKQVNHNTLMNVLEYVEESGKIYVGIKGIAWVYNPSPKMKKAITEGIRH